MIEPLELETIFLHYREILEQKVEKKDLITTELLHYYRLLIEDYCCTKQGTEEMKQYDTLLFLYVSDYRFQSFVKQEGEFLLLDALKHLQMCKQKLEQETLRGIKNTQWL